MHFREFFWIPLALGFPTDGVGGFPPKIGHGSWVMTFQIATHDNERTHCGTHVTSDMINVGSS